MAATGNGSRSRLLVEPRGQDRLHCLVAILAEVGGPRTGGFEPGGAVPLAEPQDALRAPEAIERPIAEQVGDERGTRRPDRRRALLAPARGLQQELDLVRRQVVEEGPALCCRSRHDTCTLQGVAPHTHIVWEKENTGKRIREG